MVALRGIRLGDMSYLILLCGSRLLAGPACISIWENPHIAAYWLYIRFEMFKREVLRKKWGMMIGLDLNGKGAVRDIVMGFTGYRMHLILMSKRCVVYR